VLNDWLKPAIRRKRRGLLPKGVVMLHDNACPHTAAHTAETLREPKFDVMTHPPYSPDLAPCDYHMFVPLRTKKWRKWCMRGSLLSRKHSFLRA
jgi:histone-lysine N-methyltransferase SETMAR